MSDPVDTAARTAWAEARGDGATGMQAVLNVVMNRANHPRWWGGGVVGVCRAPWQFSCWNAGDPNLPKLLAVDDTDPQFAIALDLARNAVAGDLSDITGGADSYYAVGMNPAPTWCRRASFSVRVLHHSFWRVELPAPSGQPEAPCLRAVTPETADALMAAEQTQIESQT